MSLFVVVVRFGVRDEWHVPIVISLFWGFFSCKVELD